MWPCGIITFIRELFIAESKSQVYGHLHDFLLKNEGAASSLSKFTNFVCNVSIAIYKSVNVILEYICYDDGCHLRKYASNPIRAEQSETTKLLSTINVVIDRMHMAGHVDSWCKRTCDPSLYPELQMVQETCGLVNVSYYSISQ